MIFKEESVKGRPRVALEEERTARRLKRDKLIMNNGSQHFSKRRNNLSIGNVGPIPNVMVALCAVISPWKMNLTLK